MQKDHDYYRSDARMPGEYDPTKPPLRVRFVLWLVDVLRIRQLIGEETGDTMSRATANNTEMPSSAPRGGAQHEHGDKRDRRLARH